MHYVPESSREFLPADSSDIKADRQGIHYQSAPLYLLTLAVGGLVLVDLLASMTGAFPATFAGYRWALLAAIVGGSRILYHTLDDLASGRIGAGLALTIAFIAAVWLGESLTAALVVFITLTGECLERYTIDKAHAAIRNVFDLYPPLAHVLRGGREQECPLSELQTGDRVLVRPGERIPADGRVIEGHSRVDQSALTGESQPVEKTPGQTVFAGTMNQFGSMTFTVERTGNQTLLGQVTETVAEASHHKTISERTADRLAKWFLPIVLTAAFLTFVGWWLATGDSSAGWGPTLGVLVVACPCALVLATPTAVMASLAWLARAGIVVKGSDALERLANVDTFAFDKTGTMTQGEMAIGEVRFFRETLSSEWQEQQVLYLIATVEQQSEHPLAVPFADYAQQHNWTLPKIHQFSASVGGGVSGTVHEIELRDCWARSSNFEWPSETDCAGDREWTVRVGNLRWLKEQGLPLPDSQTAETESPVETPLFLAVNDQIIGMVGLRDTVREEAQQILVGLKNSGIRETVLLTGDRATATQTQLQSLGVLDHTSCELLPADKARWIEQHQDAGHRVAMVGDGINDAPALIASQVGIAIARRQSHLAAEAGDMVLLSPTLTPLPGLLRLSRALVQNIRQSILFFAFGLNGLGMLLAAAGVISPVTAAVLHEVGSLAVMLNALRLLWFEHSSQGWTGRLAQHTTTAAEWITTALSPSRWVYRVVDHWNTLLRLAATGAVVWWLVSNWVFLPADEQAIVTRFGKVHAELEAGWHWRWPAPFERVYREKVHRLRTLAYGFRNAAASETDAEGRERVIDWTNPHESTGEHPVPEESLLLTADEVPVELTAEVQYRITNLREFLFGNADPEESLRALTGQSLRSLAARTSLDEMLTVGRPQIERQCLDQLRDRMNPWNLGLEIVAVHLVEVHPPRGVVSSYRDVANAWEEKEQQINEAQAAAMSRLLSTAGPRALRELEKTHSLDYESHTAMSQELSDKDWQSLAAVKTQEEETRLQFLAGETADVLLEAAGNAVKRRESAHGEAARFRSLLPIYRKHPELTTTELYWNTIEAVLGSRPFTILDPNAVGRRHLFLNNSDWTEFSPRSPVFSKPTAQEPSASSPVGPE